jgi:hypothetical protein
MINISYIRLLNAFESFSNAHLQIKRFASDFPEQVPNFGTEKENYPILFVSPNNTIFDENANQFTVDVYCFDIIEKDRININTILSDTNTILNDVYRWFKDGEIFGIDVITDTPTCTPINNGLLDYTAGWQMSITFVIDTYGICEIPFNESPVVITEVCDIVYSQYLTCETLADCQTIIDIQALLPTQDQKDAMDNANGPDSTNPFATMADVGGGGTLNLQQVTDNGNTTDNDIQFDAGVGVLLDNGSRLREGTIDAGFGGSKGIAQICAVGYELKWEAGRQYVMDGNGVLIRHSLNNFTTVPSATDDSTKGYYAGSLWTLDNGISYICTDSTIGAAVWILYDANPQVNSDWNAVSGVEEILNKPTIPAAQVNSDWNATSGLAEILNKPSIPAAQIQSDWTQSNNALLDFIKNKPTIPAAQVNSDWNAVSGLAQILNKPTIPSGTVTSVATAGLISGGPITSSGTITTSMNTNKLVGRFTASAGVMQEITIGSGLTLTGAGTLNNTATPTPLGYYGAFQDVTNQTAAVINTGYPMLLGVTDLSNQVTVVSGSRVTIANTGIYNIQWSGQFTNPLAAEHDVTIWLRKNGVDVPGSAGIVLVPAKHGSSDGHVLPSWNFLLDVVGGDYYEFVWSTVNTSVYLSFTPAGTPPPSTASVVLTVTQQSGIMAGTGMTALNGLTGSVQTFVDDTNVTITSSGTSHTLGWSGTLADSRIASASKWNNAGEWVGLTAAVLSPADSTAYLMPFVPALAPATGTAGREWKFTKSGTVSNVNVASFQSANGSSENVTVYLRNTTTATDYLCGTFTMDGGVNSNTFANFSVSIAINTTDKWSIKILTPAWVTNPTVVYFAVNIFNKS